MTSGDRWQLAVVDGGNGRLTKLIEKRKDRCESEKKIIKKDKIEGEKIGIK